MNSKKEKQRIIIIKSNLRFNTIDISNKNIKKNINNPFEENALKKRIWLKKKKIYSIFEKLSSVDYKFIRKRIICEILVTDMAIQVKLYH